MQCRTLLLLAGSVAASANTYTSQVCGSGSNNIPDGIGSLSCIITVNDSGSVASGNAVTVSLVGLQHEASGDLVVTLTHFTDSSQTSMYGSPQYVFYRIGKMSSDPNDFGYSAEFGDPNGTGDNYDFGSAFPGGLWATAAALGAANFIPGRAEGVINGYATTGQFSSAATNFSAMFTGQPLAGTWRLDIADVAAGPTIGSTGSLLQWQLALVNGPPPPASLSIAKSHTGNITQGQQNATYTVTVSNAANASATSGTVTVTETVPSGLMLVSLAGMGWMCPANGNTCTRSDALNGGASYLPITVTVNVAANATSPQINQAGVSGGGSAAANTTDPTTILANCSYGISPNATTAQAAGGPGMVNVTAANGCGWTAASNANFISITAGASGSGNGAVSYSVTANAGPDRSGTLTIAGQTFTLMQPALPPQTWVSGGGDDANACDRATPCKTFAGAIAKTSASGEIDCLDPGEFGTLTITKAITINCGSGDGGSSGSVQASATDGFVVQAPANATVALRNISFQGNSGSGLNAIRFLSGAYLHIQHVHIVGFSQNGIDVNNPAFAIATVRNSVIGEIGQAGVNVVYPASGAVSLDSVQISNAATGVHAGTNAQVMLTRSTIMGTQTGTSIGIKADTGGAAINIDSTLIAFCSTGVSASGGGNVLLANSSINNNSTGVSGNVSSSSPLTNTFFNNTSNGVFGGGAVTLK